MALGALKKINRSISCFLQGLINIVADLLCGKGIYLNDLFPQSPFVVNKLRRINLVYN